ncbi:MAG: hypothetical protein ACRD82_04990 [Blastocatellia bacterium]
MPTGIVNLTVERFSLIHSSEFNEAMKKKRRFDAFKAIRAASACGILLCSMGVRIKRGLRLSSEAIAAQRSRLIAQP